MHIILKKIIGWLGWMILSCVFWALIFKAYLLLMFAACFTVVLVGIFILIACHKEAE